MTAEIAILSRSAVALAADSAVTITRYTSSGEEETRVLKSANKVFALSRSKPIAVMVFGDAVLMGVPWETIIKIYREERTEISFDSVEDYAKDFFSFLESNQSLFPPDAQEAAAVDEMTRYAYMVLGQAIRTLPNSKRIGKRAFNAAIANEIEKEIKFIEKAPLAHGFNPAKAKTVLAEYKDPLEEIISNVFSNCVISEPRKRKLKAILVGAITRVWFQEAGAGIVFAGFGDQDHFPGLRGYRCRGVFENVFLYTERENGSVTVSTPAVIEPFAQTEMVKTFLYGIDPKIERAVRSYLSTAFKELLKVVKSKTPAAHPEVASATKDMQEQFNKGFAEYMIENHVAPMYRIVDNLAKDELAELAETLIIMESLKKRVTQSVESVGGPVDVAIISKAEGVIWIKRKHYFDRALNENYFVRLRAGEQQ